MKTPVRIDYAAEGHPVWLYRLDDEYVALEDAVRVAQNRLEQWPIMIGFRIVELEHPVLEPVLEQHIGKIVDLDGQKIVPWELVS